MNKFNNDSIPYNEKCIAVIIPDEENNIQSAIIKLIKAFINLYGIIVAIRKKKVHYIVLHKQEDNTRLEMIRNLNTLDLIQEHLEIIPFPKK